MATIREHLRLAKRLTPINIEKNLFDSIRALESVILKLNEKQLDNSITATDAPIFSSKRGRGTYSRATEILSGGRKKEGDPYNLFNTGAFRNSLFINVNNKEAIFGSLDPKTPTLIDDYGINILGLNDENLTKVVKGQLLPMHQQYIRKTFGI